MTNKTISPIYRRFGSRSEHSAVLVGLIHLFSVLGCAGGNNADNGVVEDVGKQVPIDSNRAIAIARAHLERLNGHSLGETKAEAYKRDSGWYVIVSSVPAVPGGHTSVQINADGKVFDVSHGE